MILVGGFAANDWLFSKLRHSLSSPGVMLFRPDRHTYVALVLRASSQQFRRSKAVADGAVSFYIDHFVRSRIAKATYGVPLDPVFNRNNPGHSRRAHNTYVIPASTELFVAGGFSPTLVKVGYTLSRFKF
jgi:hypothetical protein